jgi:hypothetical protein
MAERVPKMASIGLFLLSWYHRQTLYSAPAIHDVLRNGVCCVFLAKENLNFGRAPIDFGHHVDLMLSLAEVGLVDANGVRLDNSLRVPSPETL